MQAMPPLVFLHGIGGAARVWRGQLDAFGDRYRAIAWDMPGYGGSAPLQSVSIPALADALKDFLQQVGAAKPILVGHSIGGMIVQQLLIHDPIIAEYVVLAQTSPAFGKPDGDWQKEFLDARLGPLDRGETMASLAPTVVADLVGDDPDPAGIELACACMASVPEASYRAVMTSMLGFDLRKSLGQIRVPDAGHRRHQRQECARADGEENGKLYSERDLCRTGRRRTSGRAGTAHRIQCGAG